MQSKTCPAKFELNRCCRGAGAVFHLSVSGDRFVFADYLVELKVAGASEMTWAKFVGVCVDGCADYATYRAL